MTVILFLSNEFIIDKFVVLYLLIICISTDIGGYVFGKIIGGKKLTKISPNKTYSGSMGSFLLSAGQKGKRYSLPNSRIMVHQPSAGFQGQATDIQIHAKEIQSLKNRLNIIYSKHTGKSVEEISKALERDNFMTPEEAKNFGLIDSVVEKRK